MAIKHSLSPCTSSEQHVLGIKVIIDPLSPIPKCKNIMTFIFMTRYMSAKGIKSPEYLYVNKPNHFLRTW